MSFSSSVSVFNAIKIVVLTVMILTVMVLNIAEGLVGGKNCRGIRPKCPGLTDAVRNVAVPNCALRQDVWSAVFN